jgi:PAS domain S-box-containing protein
MRKDEQKKDKPERSASSAPTSSKFEDVASDFATFELPIGGNKWNWSPAAALLLGLDPDKRDKSSAGWERAVFVDDLQKIRNAAETAKQTNTFYCEFRVTHSDGNLHWLAAKGRVISKAGLPAGLLRGTLYEITDRKALEARLLALNETLEARVVEVREEARTLEVLNRTGIAVAAEHDLERLVQLVTDAAVELTCAEFGAFFYNVTNELGEAYTLYILSGAPR